MKQLITILFIATLTMCAHAQDSTAMQHRLMIGVHGGAGPASMVGMNNGPKSSITNLGARLGFMSGMFFQYRIIPRMALCFELNYESKGYSVSGEIPNQWQYSSNSSVDPTIPWPVKMRYIEDFLTIPVLLKFKINKSKKRTEWFVKGGFSTELLVRSGTRFQREPFRPDESFNREFDISVVSGLGVNIPVRKRAVISIEGRDNMNVGDVTHFINRNLLVVLIGVGYKI